MLTRKLTPFKEECFLRLREVLRRADAAFTNRRSWRRENPEGEVAKRVIERVARLSLPYGTSHRPEWDGDYRGRIIYDSARISFTRLMTSGG